MQLMRMLVLALIAAAPVTAQQPMGMPRDSMHRGMMRPGMQGMMEMMGPMMRGMVFAPGNLLRHREDLGLTVQQVTRLTALHDEATTAHDAAMADARAHHEQLAEVMKAAKPDTAAARRHFDAAHGAMGKAHWAQLRAAAQARAVLTDVQRARVDGWADAMRMGQGGGPHGPGAGEASPGPHHPPR
jgi:Spy/CpxP family protein refolding chaperone